MLFSSTSRSVSECQQIQDSCPFQKGDQILAVNDLLTDTVEEMHRYLKRLSKDEVVKSQSTRMFL